jgi:hypothetical protein
MRYLFLFPFTLIFSCKVHSPNLALWNLTQNNEESPPVFQFEYRTPSAESIVDSSVLQKVGDGFCLYSIPHDLYVLETGAKFNICVKSNQETISILEAALLDMNRGLEANASYPASGKFWKAEVISYGNWKKETLHLIPKNSYSDHRTLDGTIAFHRFDVPNAEFFQWSDSDCEAIFPSQHIGNTHNSRKVLRFQFKCGSVDFLEKINVENQKLSSNCKATFPSVGERFRHSESPFQKFVEWENDSDETLCPNFDTIQFIEQTSGKVTTLSKIELQKLKERHKYILPKSSIIWTDAEQLSGVSISNEMLNNIGKKGNWVWDSGKFLEEEFLFKQGSEFFSNGRPRGSCRDQLRFHSHITDVCMSPGVFDGLLVSFDQNKSRVCDVESLEITEFFTGRTNPNVVPIFLEIQNKGSKCDLSGIDLVYHEERFPLSAKEFLIESNEIFLISTKSWDGWQIRSVTKPLSTKEFKYQLPKILILERGTQNSKSYNSAENQFVLTNETGQTNRSMLLQSSRVLPHPDVESSILNPLGQLHISPGVISETGNIPFLPLKISEILLTGTKNENFSYAERFIEWEDLQNREGFVSFLISGVINRHFIFYKSRQNEFPLVYTELGNCIPKMGIELPEGSLPNEDLDFFVFDSRGRTLPNPSENQFSYRKNKLQELGQNSSARLSVHPERLPFEFSLSNDSTFLCAPHSNASPGKANIRSNRWIETVFQSIGGVPRIQQIKFLFEPSLSDKFRFSNQSIQVDYPAAVLTEGGDYLVNFLSGIEDYLSNFITNGLIYLDWYNAGDIKKSSLIFKLGEVRIEGVYPSPPNPQNEWIYFCNTTQSTVNLQNYKIEDETSKDQIVSYSTRYPNKIPSFKGSQVLNWTSSLLASGDCAFLVDPDGAEWYLPPFAKSTDLLLTIASTQTIGNGVSNSERLNLYKQVGSIETLISSYGKFGTPSSFTIPLQNGEYSLLKKERLGNQSSDFYVFSE